MRISYNQLLLITILFILYSAFATIAIGIKRTHEPMNINEYEVGKHIGQRSKTE